MKAEVDVARGATSLYVATATNLLLNTLYFVVLTNVLPTAEVGLATLLNVLVVGLATVAVLSSPLVGSPSFANPSAVARFLPKYLGDGRGKAARRLFTLSLVSAICISVASYVALTIPSVSHAIAGSLSATSVEYAGIDAGIFSIGQLGAYGLIGAGKTARASAIIVGSVVTKYAVASLLVLHGWGVPGVFIGYAIGDAVLAAASVPYVFRSLPDIGSAKGDTAAVRAYIAGILPSGLIGFAVSQAASLLAFVQKGLSDLAIYNIASVAGGITALAPVALTNVLVPLLSSTESGDEASKRTMMTRYTKYVGFVSLPIGFGLAAIAPALLRIFGPAYSSAAPLVAITCVSAALTSMTAVYASDLIASGKTWFFLAGNAIALLSLVAVAAIAVPGYGLLGVAVGRATMFFVSLAAFALFVKRLGNLVFDSNGYVKMAASSALMAAVLFAAVSAVGAAGLVSKLDAAATCALCLLIGGAVYLTCLKLLKAFDQEDMEFLEKVMPTSFRPITRLVRRLIS